MISAGWQGRTGRNRERERENESKREEENILGYQPASQPAPANIDRVLSRMRLRHCYPGLSTLPQFLIVRFPCPRPRSWPCVAVCVHADTRYRRDSTAYHPREYEALRAAGVIARRRIDRRDATRRRDLSYSRIAIFSA